ncbi:MAG: hypothetical protein Q4C45_10350, partial [Oscillospiraceae bacterium]|nr:hypothetical protein [Oscillospiraceae bacterium]
MRHRISPILLGINILNYRKYITRRRFFQDFFIGRGPDEQRSRRPAVKRATLKKDGSLCSICKALLLRSLGGLDGLDQQRGDL